MKATLGFVGLAAAAALASGGMYQTVTIDFDDLQGGIAPPVETDGMFSDFATFSTQADHVLLVFSGGGFVGGSDPNVLTAAESVDASSFDSDIYVDFTDPVRNLTFDVLADNDAGVVAQVLVAHAGGTNTIDVVGNANINDAVAIDLTAYTDVSRIELFNITDEFGLSVDNFVFDTLVPAPGTLAGLGLVGLAATRRRR